MKQVSQADHAGDYTPAEADLLRGLACAFDSGRHDLVSAIGDGLIAAQELRRRQGRPSLFDPQSELVQEIGALAWERLVEMWGARGGGRA